jgi:E-phenylitaconyl-CoA hydratase
MECTAIEFEVRDHIATITLNRPEQYNSFNDAMGREIEWAWQEVRDNDDIHVAVLQANGEKAFCTGVDIKGGATWFTKENPWNSFDPGVTLSPKLHHKVWKPVIVAVHGLCAGGAMYFLNEADIIICSDDAEFFDPHANGGIVSALEPIGMVARNVPLGDVLRWALMGNEERLTPETALRLGIVSEVVPRAELRERAREIARSIAERNPVAIQGTVRAIWESLDLTRTAALQQGLAYPLIGNPGKGVHPSGKKVPPTYR